MSDNTIKPKHDSHHVTTSHAAPKDKMGYSHELHSAALSSNSYAPSKVNSDTVNFLIRPLTSKEISKVPLSERSIKRMPAGGDTHLAMRKTLQSKSQALILPRLAKKNTTPTTPPAA
jgi:hypothetical protein